MHGAEEGIFSPPCYTSRKLGIFVGPARKQKLFALGFFFLVRRLFADRNILLRRYRDIFRDWGGYCQRQALFWGDDFFNTKNMANSIVFI